MTRRRRRRRLFIRLAGAVEHWRADRHRWEVIDGILADLGQPARHRPAHRRARRR